jgi:proton glutamate symport protein
MNAGIPAIARPVQLFLRQNLALQVLEGLLVGLVVGLLLPAANLVLAPIGQIFGRVPLRGVKPEARMP